MSEREQLEQAISHMESQRAILGDAVVNAALAPLREKLAELARAEEETKIGPAGERRIVTILFCDVTGSTELAEQLDPEAWRGIMDRAFDYLIEPVDRFGGTIARLMGDAILAFFGAPVAHEDDPERAVLAGLAIVEGIGPYRQELEQKLGLRFDVRVGINTGLVVVGEVGTDVRGEYTAMGDAVNLAARMEQTARPGTVQISETTRRKVSQLFDFEDLGPITVKGKREQMRAYRVLGSKQTVGLLRGIPGLEAPLIGREAEFARLTEAVDHLRQGSGRVVCLLGEAGLGKSRLIRELKAYATADERPPTADSRPPAPDPRSRSGRSATAPIDWFLTASLSYEMSQPYSLFQRLIRQMCGAMRTDPPSLLREKIGELAGTLPPEEQDHARQAFESLFGLGGDDGRPLLEGESFKRQLFAATTALLAHRAGERPLVVVCDDLHWTDPASAELLQHLMSLVDPWPLLLLLAMRPDRQSPGWSVRQAAERDYPHRLLEIAVRPLTAADSDTLVNSLLTIADLPPALRARILDKTEGNPFFVEEVVRALIESDLVVQDKASGHWLATSELADIHIPDNLQALLVARIDRLEAETRRVLQLAALIGRSFYYRVLSTITGAGTSLDRHLIALQRVELIREAARIPELEYIFRHALTQEAAYETILHSERRAFHARVGQVMESLFPEQLEELAPTLAYHFFEGGDCERALTYYTMAGDVAYRLYAHVEAVEHYSKAIECVSQVEVDSETIIHLYNRRGRALELFPKFGEALDNYKSLEALAQSQDDPAMRLTALLGRATIHATQTPYQDPAKAESLAQEALILAQELKDPPSEAKAHWILLMAYVFGLGDVNLAQAHGEEAIRLARQHNLDEQLAFILGNIAMVYWGQDKMDKAEEAIMEARDMWQKLNNLPMLADAYAIASYHYMMTGDNEASLKTGEEAVVISRSIDNIWNWSGSLQQIGFVYADLGDAGRALDVLEEGIRLMEKANITHQVSVNQIMEAMVYTDMGAFEQARQICESLMVEVDAMPIFRRTLILTMAALLYTMMDQLPQARTALAAVPEDFNDEFNQAFQEAFNVMGQAAVALAEGQPDQALEVLIPLIARLRQAKVRSPLPTLIYLQGRAYLAQGETDNARQAFSEALAASEYTGERRTRWEILAELAGLTPDPAEAGRLRDQAREIIAFIADHAGRAELRESFLARPRVRDLNASG